jgi:hypothetical protein
LFGRHKKIIGKFAKILDIISQWDIMGYIGIFNRRRWMKKRFWSVGIEIYSDGRVLAAVLRSREAKHQPQAAYRKEPGREVFGLWFNSEAEAQGAVLEALAMNRKQGAAA